MIKKCASIFDYYQFYLNFQWQDRLHLVIKKTKYLFLFFIRSAFTIFAIIKPTLK